MYAENIIFISHDPPIVYLVQSTTTGTKGRAHRWMQCASVYKRSFTRSVFIHVEIKPIYFAILLG